MRHDVTQDGLERIDPEKRSTLRRLAAGAAFVAPVVLSFPLGGLSISDARAYVDGGDDRSDLLPVPGDPSDDPMARGNRQRDSALPQAPASPSGSRR